MNQTGALKPLASNKPFGPHIRAFYWCSLANHNDLTFHKFVLQARPVYVNYTRVEDFKELRKMNINVSGNIVIAKYGKIYRGDKVSSSTKQSKLINQTINESIY